MAPDIGRDNEFLVRVLALEGSAEEIEQHGYEIDVCEAEDEARGCSREQESDFVAGFVGGAGRGYYEGLGELEGEGEGEGAEEVGFAAVEEGEGPEEGGGEGEADVETRI